MLIKEKLIKIQLFSFIISIFIHYFIFNFIPFIGDYGQISNFENIIINANLIENNAVIENQSKDSNKLKTDADIAIKKSEEVKKKQVAKNKKNIFFIYLPFLKFFYYI